MATERARFIFSKGVSKQIGSVSVDVYRSENHNNTASVTNYPIEDGADITDHVQNDPDTISIEGLIAATNAEEDAAGALRPLNAYQELKQLKRDRQPITIVTGLEVYTNMIITSLSVPRNASNGASLSFSLSAQKANLVASQTVVIPKSRLGGDEETNRQAQGESNQGKASSGQTQEQAAETEEERNKWLEQIEQDVDAVFGIVGG